MNGPWNGCGKLNPYLLRWMTWHLCVISDVRTPSGKVPPRRRAVQHDELMMTFIELGEQEPGLVDLVSVLHDIAAWRGRRCSRPRTSSPPPSACAPPIMIRCDNSTCAAPGDNGDDERNGRSRRPGGGGQHKERSPASGRRDGLRPMVFCVQPVFRPLRGAAGAEGRAARRADPGAWRGRGEALV